MAILRERTKLEFGRDVPTGVKAYDHSAYIQCDGCGDIKLYKCLSEAAYFAEKFYCRSCGSNRRALEKAKAAGVIAGAKFNKLTVIGEVISVKKGAGWRKCVKCSCFCGNTTDVIVAYLVSGKVKSCGCASYSHSSRDIYKPIPAGSTSNFLTCIEEIQLFLPNGKKRSPGVRCLCSCGQETIITKRAFILGDIKSCGCLQIKAAKMANNKVKCKDPRKSNIASLFNHYKYSAKKRSLLFELSLTQFETLTQQICSYCGSAPSNIESTIKDDLGTYVYNGIDRVDNTKGYTIDNSVTCCTMCNKMKLTLTKEVFLTHIKKIHNFNL